MNTHTVEQSITSQLLDAILNSSTPENRYRAIHDIHATYAAQNVSIVYPEPTNGGIIDIAMIGQQGYGAIKLSERTNFNGWTFRVTTSTIYPPSGEQFLFYFQKYRSEQDIIPIAPTRREIDTGCFHDVEGMTDALCLVEIQDQNTWTFRNDTPNTYVGQLPWSNWNENDPIKRKDILLVKNKEAVNRPIAPYNTVMSEPTCQYVLVNSREKVFENVTFERTSNCAVRVNLLHSFYTNNITIRNVTVITDDPSAFVKDCCINIGNATNVRLENINFATKLYSTETAAGYGIQLNNVWNVKMVNLQASKPIWGVVGTNNVNHMELEGVPDGQATDPVFQLNRLDIHCYGRDIICKNCTFTNETNTTQYTFHTLNRFSSLMGYLRYENCVFDGFRPVRMDTGYNAFMGYDLYFKNCTVVVRRSQFNYLLDMGFWGAPRNQRLELRKKCWPNITIENMILKVNDDINQIDLYHLLDRGVYTDGIDYLEHIKIRNLEWKHLNGLSLSPSEINNKVFAISNKSVTANQLYHAFIEGVNVPYTNTINNHV